MEFLFSISLLHQAVIERDYERVKKILEDTIENPTFLVNAKSFRQVRTLENFISYRSRDEVDEILDKIFGEYDIRTLNGWTPLNWAIFNDDEKMVNLLIEYGADIHTYDSVGATPLHWAGLWASPKIIVTLVDYGSDFKIRDKEGFTPLYRAIQRESRKQDVNILKMFISRGARINRTDKEGRNAFHIAAYVNNYHAINYLLSLNPSMIESRDDQGNTPLHWATTSKGSPNNLLTIKSLLAKKANQEARNDNDATPLLIATLRRNVPAIRFLLERSSNGNAQNDAGDTPLHIAARWGYDDVIRIFYDLFQGKIGRIQSRRLYPLNPSIRNDAGYNALEVALYMNKPFAAKEVLNFKPIDPLDYDPQGQTSLHLGVKNQNIDLLDILITKAKQNHKKDWMLFENAQRMRPLDLAVYSGNVEMVVFLIRRGGIPSFEEREINRLLGFARTVKMGKFLLNFKENPKLIYFD